MEQATHQLDKNKILEINMINTENYEYFVNLNTWKY